MKKNNLAIYATQDAETLNIDLSDLEDNGIVFERPIFVPRIRNVGKLLERSGHLYSKTKQQFRLLTDKGYHHVHVTPVTFVREQMRGSIRMVEVLVPPSFLNEGETEIKLGGQFAIRNMAIDTIIDHRQGAKRTLNTALVNLFKRVMASGQFKMIDDMYDEADSKILTHLLRVIDAGIWNIRPVHKHQSFSQLTMKKMIEDDLTSGSQLVCRVRKLPTKGGTVVLMHLFVSGFRTKAYLETTGFIANDGSHEWKFRTPYCE